MGGVINSLSNRKNKSLIRKNESGITATFCLHHQADTSKQTGSRCPRNLQKAHGFWLCDDFRRNRIHLTMHGQVLKYAASFKYADITPIFKKDYKTGKTNHRPISILPSVSEIYERFMQNQIYPYLSQIFSGYQCGFRRGFNAQQCLMVMIEKCCESLGRGCHSGASH